MQHQINPWSSQQTVDLDKLFNEFGIEPISSVIDLLPEVPYFMRRGIVVGHRDYRHIARGDPGPSPVPHSLPASCRPGIHTWGT